MFEDVEKTTEEEILDNFWKKWINSVDPSKVPCDDDSKDVMKESLYEVVKAAYEVGQHLHNSDEFEDVDRIVKIRIKLPRANIEKMFGVKTYSIYGVGLYTTLKGICLTPSTREKINYDTFTKKGVKFDLSSIPEDVRKTHDFRLTIPAGKSGLFVPLKTELTDWLSGTWSLQYFDLDF